MLLHRDCRIAAVRQKTTNKVYCLPQNFPKIYPKHITSHLIPTHHITSNHITSNQITSNNYQNIKSQHITEHNITATCAGGRAGHTCAPIA